MLLDRYDEPTSPFTPIPLDSLDWTLGATETLELDAELLPAFMFLERNRDALKFVVAVEEHRAARRLQPLRRVASRSNHSTEALRTSSHPDRAQVACPLGWTVSQPLDVRTPRGCARDT
jgi:hypothetical protein